MAYGKDDSHLANIASYGASMTQKMGQATRRAPRTGGNRPYWLNQFKPHEHYQDTVRILPGKYNIKRADESGEQTYLDPCPWFEFVEHYSSITKQGGVCSAGPDGLKRTLRSPCVGCDIFWTDFQARKKIQEETGHKVKNPNRVGRSQKFVFNVLDLGFFFKAPQRDSKTGQFRVNPSTSTPYTDWVKYYGPHQDAEKAEAQQVLGAAYQERYGNVMQWPLGRDHFSTLNRYGDLIGANCASCGGKNSIQSHAWHCNSCNQELMNATTSGLGPDKVKEVVQAPMTCRCGHIGLPREVLSCANCPNPRRATIFDVNLTVTTQKDAKGSTILLVPSYTDPCGIHEAYHDLLEKLPDLEKKYVPLPFGEQAQKYGDRGGQPQAQQGYSQPQQPAQPQQVTYGQSPPQQPAYQQPQQQYQPQQQQPQDAAPEQGYVPQEYSTPQASPPLQESAPVDVPPGYADAGPYGGQQ